MQSLSAKQLLDLGYKGKEVGSILKSLKNASPQEVEHFLKTRELPKHEQICMLPGTVWHWLCFNECFDNFRGASNSEKRRWLENKSVIINGRPIGPDEACPWDKPEDLVSLVFFPSGTTVTMI